MKLGAPVKTDTKCWGREDCLKHMEIIRKAFSEKYSGSRLKGQMFDQIL